MFITLKKYNYLISFSLLLSDRGLLHILVRKSLDIFSKYFSQLSSSIRIENIFIYFKVLCKRSQAIAIVSSFSYHINFYLEYRFRIFYLLYAYFQGEKTLLNLYLSTPRNLSRIIITFLQLQC